MHDFVERFPCTTTTPDGNQNNDKDTSMSLAEDNKEVEPEDDKPSDGNDKEIEPGDDDVIEKNDR